MISFQVYGLPAAQGSKNPWGGEANKQLKPWRNDVAVAALASLNGEPLIAGPVSLRAVFIFPRPKSHYRTGKRAGDVKENAPGWKTSAPDLDKLVRAVGDALTGVLFRDDAQIVDIAVTKIYGQTPGVHVKIEELE